VDFAAKIAGLGLSVDTIVPAHGRRGTMDDLTEALAVQPPRD
jgi:hypothetical protein